MSIGFAHFGSAIRNLSIGFALVIATSMMALGNEPSQLLDYPNTAVAGTVSAEVPLPLDDCKKLCEQRQGCMGIDHRTSTNLCSIFSAVSGATADQDHVGATRKPIPAYHSPANQAVRVASERLGNYDIAKFPMAISLTWDDTHDLDLELVCPDGSSVSARSPPACGGHLQLDANYHDKVEDPVELILWDQEPSKGKYQVIVELYDYSERAPIEFAVILWREGTPTLFHGHTSRSTDRRTIVTEFTVP